MIPSRRSFVAGASVLAGGLVVPGLHAQPKKPAITVYRDPT
jgi:hypothetical protein